MRALARDMGRALGCLGHVIALRRTRVGPFEEGDAVRLEDLEAAAEAGRLRTRTAPCCPSRLPLRGSAGTDGQPVRCREPRARQAVLIRGRDAPVLSGPIYATCKGRLVALGEVEKGALHPTRVFNLG